MYKFASTFKHQRGFTLAEVLVTLAIIGVVAALTIPTLINTIQKQQYVSGMLEANHILSDATLQIIQDRGSMLGIAPNYTGDPAMQIYCTKLNCIKQCGDSEPTISGCFAPGVKALSGVPFYLDLGIMGGAGASALLNNGMALGFYHVSSNCNPGGGRDGECGQILVDTNGFKGPNIVGRDIFNFLYTRTGIVPVGTCNYNDCWYYSNRCDTTNTTEVVNGSGCTARIILDGNQMTY